MPIPSRPQPVSPTIRHNYDDPDHDPYYVREKFPEGCVCRGCGSSYEKGKFIWPSSTATGSNEIECPACRRSREKVAGGYVHLEGGFLMEHQKEIANLIGNVAHAEMAQYPLQRLIEVKPLENGIELTTTYEHIARRIADAVHRAYKGEMTLQYQDAEKRVRIHWIRE